MRENLLTFLVYAICAIAIAIPFLVYQNHLKKREARARRLRKGEDVFQRATSNITLSDNDGASAAADCTILCPEGMCLWPLEYVFPFSSDARARASLFFKWF